MPYESGDTEQGDLERDPVMPLGVGGTARETPGTAIADGRRVMLRVDGLGNLFIRSATPDPSIGADLYSSINLESAAQLKATAGRVMLAAMQYVSSGGGDRVLMLIDKVAVPVNGDQPVWRGVLPDPGAGNFGMAELGFEEIEGLQFANGIWIAASTTLDSLTLPGAPETLFTTAVI